ncbi:hypothetical protein ACSYAY_01340 [Leptospirillum ferriphilum]|uniref:Uncharacterized protein n=1 Tax=Leptospirillum ferriphilum TaxID=178606 RepID=A0A1V3SV52_9BACT|nr:hypothetical protein [Leptospirillum ferriphilum]OOH72751.1 hypothetical protein BOX24_05020 [Leptospirillum ferriphilum]
MKKLSITLDQTTYGLIQRQAAESRRKVSRVVIEFVPKVRSKDSESNTLRQNLPKQTKRGLKMVRTLLFDKNKANALC